MTVKTFVDDKIATFLQNAQPESETTCIVTFRTPPNGKQIKDEDISKLMLELLSEAAFRCGIIPSMYKLRARAIVNLKCFTVQTYKEVIERLSTDFCKMVESVVHADDSTAALIPTATLKSLKSKNDISTLWDYYWTRDSDIYGNPF